jgi:hypothetical protein
MTRQRQFLILGLGAGIVIVLALVLFTSKTIAGTPCDKLLSYVRKGDTDKSYQLFSPTAQTKTSKSDWSDIAANLRSVLQNKDMNSQKTSKISDVSEQTVYQPKGELSPTITCIINSSGTKKLISGLIINQ